MAEKYVTTGEPDPTRDIVESEPESFNIVHMFTCPTKGGEGDEQAPMQQQDEIEVVKGRGIVGDRYFIKDDGSVDGNFNHHRVPNEHRNLTIMSLDGLEKGNNLMVGQFNGETPMLPEETRRNVFVNISADDLNKLAETQAEFWLGGLKMKAIELAKPCWRPPAYVGRKVDHQAFTNGFQKFGGIRVQILESGTIRKDAKLELPKNFRRPQ